MARIKTPTDPERRAGDAWVNNAVMSGEASDLRLAGTERSVVAAQYEDSSNLQSRVNVYAYLCPEQPLPNGVTFEDWVLDHLDWTGEESALDIGCGPGGFLSPLSLRAGRVMGFDLSLGMLARAMKRTPDCQAHLAVADIQALPLVSDSVDVVVAAFMLYHVPHLDRAIEELFRVLQSGGAILAVTNGPGDKAEIRQAWQEAGRRIVGQTFNVPHWSDNFNLDNGATVLGERFDVVAVDRTRGTFEFPEPGPVLAWVQSLRPGLEGGIEDATWMDVMGELRRVVAHEIEAQGTFAAGKDSGLVIARKRAT
jgi:SAM-dependent methyltransferase